MKNKGEEDYKIDPEEHGEEAHERDDRKWYQKIDKKILDEMPVVGRPRGKGIRVDFYVESQFPDMMLEIKEASKRRFKNTNDVCRAAFYIGAYVLREKIVGKSAEDLSVMYTNLECFHHKENKKAAIKKEFVHHFEQRCLGNLSEEELCHIGKIILRSVSDPELKKWAAKEMDEIAKSDSHYDRMSATIRKQKSRAKKDELGLQVISND